MISLRENAVFACDPRGELRLSPWVSPLRSARTTRGAGTAVFFDALLGELEGCLTGKDPRPWVVLDERTLERLFSWSRR